MPGTGDGDGSWSEPLCDLAAFLSDQLPCQMQNLERWLQASAAVWGRLHCPPFPEPDVLTSQSLEYALPVAGVKMRSCSS